MKTFDTGKLLKLIYEWKIDGWWGKHHAHLPGILNHFFQKEKYAAPQSFTSLHKYFKKIKKSFKYETIFNVYADYRRVKDHEYWFELGILTIPFKKKKFFFIIIYWQDTTGVEQSMFGIEMQHKIKKFPDSESLYNLASKYLFNELWFKTSISDEYVDEYGDPIPATWGDVVNFSNKLKLRGPKFKRGIGLTDKFSDWSRSSARRTAIDNLFYQNAKIDFNFKN